MRKIDLGDSIPIGDGVVLLCATCPECFDRTWVVNGNIHRCCEHLDKIEVDEEQDVCFVFDGVIVKGGAFQ